LFQKDGDLLTGSVRTQCRGRIADAKERLTPTCVGSRPPIDHTGHLVTVRMWVTGILNRC